MLEKKPLTDNFHSFMAETWDGDEDDIPMGMLLKSDGSVTVIALALSPEEAYQAMLQMVIVEQAVEAIFALDRFTKPGQGTEYTDVLAGHYFDRSLGRQPWRPFIIEYEKVSRHFKPIDWDNEFWNGALIGELNASMRAMIQRISNTILDKR